MNVTAYKYRENKGNLWAYFAQYIKYTCLKISHIVKVDKNFRSNYNKGTSKNTAQPVVYLSIKEYCFFSNMNRIVICI